MQARDIAQYLLVEFGDMSPMKLQKVLYYCQAWSLVWDGKRLFDDPIEAWVKGPVVRDVWVQNRGATSIHTVNGDATAVVDRESIDTIRSVMKFYGQKTGQALSDLTHSEEPWIKAYSKRPNAIITRASIYDFYSAEANRLSVAP